MVMASQDSDLEVEITRLRDLDLAGLRARWRSVFRRRAPEHLSRHLLYRIIAYRLQADRYGDLDRETVRFLERVAAGKQSAGDLKGMDGHAARHGLRPGTVLVREWNGTDQRVAVLDQGFAWNGTTYRSLSEVARVMTGTSWSGPKFFGLKNRLKKTSSERASS